MSDVIFNPDQGNGFDFRGGGRGGPAVGAITKAAMKLTGIQDERKINQALVVVAVICFVISAYVLWTTF